MLLSQSINYNTIWSVKHYQITWQIHYHKHKKCQSSLFVFWPDNNNPVWLGDGTIDIIDMSEVFFCNHKIHAFILATSLMIINGVYSYIKRVRIANLK